jgi:phage terminase large subunit-like protein
LGSGLLSKIPTSSSAEVKTTTSDARTQQVQQEVKSIAQSYGATSSSKVEMGGKIVIDVNLNGAQGLSPTQREELQKILSDKFRELDIQNYIVNISTPPDAMGKPK